MLLREYIDNVINDSDAEFVTKRSIMNEIKVLSDNLINHFWLQQLQFTLSVSTIKIMSLTISEKSSLQQRKMEKKKKLSKEMIKEIESVTRTSKKK